MAFSLPTSLSCGMMYPMAEWGGQSVLVLDVFGDELAGLLDVERDTGPDAVNIEQLVPALDFAV
jgi:hypothetical protein